MQDLEDAQFKRDNVLSRLSLSEIPSETKEYVKGLLKSIETQWALYFLNCFSLFLQNN